MYILFERNTKQVVRKSTKINQELKKKDLKKLDEITEIEDLIPLISNHESILKNNAKRMVLYDGNLNSNLMIIYWEAQAKKRMNKVFPLWVELVNYLTKCFQLSI